MGNARLERRNWEELAKQAKFKPALLAAKSAVSLRQLERIFKEQFQQSPKSWLSEFRRRLASDLISKEWSTKAVARELNFADESHFCHDFKKGLGVVPQSFAPGEKRGMPPIKQASP